MAEIKINVKHNENFTAASLMWRYAKENETTCINKHFKTCILLQGEFYSYDHWEITPCEEAPGYDTVTLYLIKEER